MEGNVRKGKMVQEYTARSGGEGRKEKMWAKKDKTKERSQNRINQCKTREGQRRRNAEDEGIRSRCEASHGNT